MEHGVKLLQLESDCSCVSLVQFEAAEAASVRYKI